MRPRIFDMRPHLFKECGRRKVRAGFPEFTLTFATFEGACRWARRIFEEN